jgi:hypothetical protein
MTGLNFSHVKPNQTGLRIESEFQFTGQAKTFCFDRTTSKDVAPAI